jgi:death on curing protein
VTEHLDLDDLLVAAEAALGEPPKVRDIGILEAAVARTRASRSNASSAGTRKSLPFRR